jgi:hypothetical protein
MKKIKALFLSFLLTGLAQNSFAGKPPTQPNSYDGAAPTARTMAMAGAATGLAGFSDAYYYNSAMYGFSSAATKAEVSGVVVRQSDVIPSQVARMDPSGQGLTSFIMVKDTGALIWQALSDNTISNTYDDGSWHKTETYINQLIIAAGQKNDKGTSIGINFTYLYGKIGESSLVSGVPYSNMASGNGFALDLSFAYPAGKNVFFGVNFKNIAGFMFWDDYNTEQLPLIIRTGTGYHMKGFLFATDYEKRFYRFGDLQEEYVRIGLEQYINSAVCLRAGAVSNDSFDTDSLQYSYGIGFRIGGYELSFAGEQSKIYDDKSFVRYMLSFSAMVK